MNQTPMMAATILSGMLASESEEGYTYSAEISKPTEGEGWEDIRTSCGTSCGPGRKSPVTGEQEWFKPVVIKSREQIMAEIAVKHMNALCAELEKNKGEI